MLLGVSSPEAFFGALSSAERVEFLDPKDFALWGAIGAFGGVPAAFEARVSLLGELREAISRGGDARRFGGLVRALEDTLQGLFQRGEDSTAGAFFEEIRQISFRSPETGLARALGLGWPPPSKVHLRVLGASPAAERLRELYGL
jgi:hypothetical protein